jgi:hypothetical protein
MDGAIPRGTAAGASKPTLRQTLRSLRRLGLSRSHSRDLPAPRASCLIQTEGRDGGVA